MLQILHSGREPGCDALPQHVLLHLTRCGARQVIHDLHVLGKFLPREPGFFQERGKRGNIDSLT